MYTTVKSKLNYSNWTYCHYTDQNIYQTTCREVIADYCLNVSANICMIHLAFILSFAHCIWIVYSCIAYMTIVIMTMKLKLKMDYLPQSLGVTHIILDSSFFPISLPIIYSIYDHRLKSRLVSLCTHHWMSEWPYTYMSVVTVS